MSSKYDIYSEFPIYVYEHWVDGKCIYVGAGKIKNNRAYDFKKRGKLWFKLTKGAPEVKIRALFKKGEDAGVLEVKLIKEYKKIGWCEANNIYKGYMGEEHAKKCRMSQLTKSRVEINRNNNLGCKNPMYGKLAHNRVPVVQLTKDNKLVKKHDSLEDAVNFINGKSKGNIVSVCKGNRPYANGYKWKYYEDYLKENNINE